MWFAFAVLLVRYCLPKLINNKLNAILLFVSKSIIVNFVVISNVINIRPIMVNCLRARHYSFNRPAKLIEKWKKTGFFRRTSQNHVFHLSLENECFRHRCAEWSRRKQRNAKILINFIWIRKMQYSLMTTPTEMMETWTRSRNERNICGSWGARDERIAPETLRYFMFQVPL